MTTHMRQRGQLCWQSRRRKSLHDVLLPGAGSFQSLAEPVGLPQLEANVRGRFGKARRSRRTAKYLLDALFVIGQIRGARRPGA